MIDGHAISKHSLSSIAMQQMTHEDNRSSNELTIKIPYISEADLKLEAGGPHLPSISPKFFVVSPLFSLHKATQPSRVALQ